MKKYFLLTFIIVVSLNCSLLASGVSTSIRQKTKFNADWKFMLGDNADYKNPTFDDSAWRSLSLPHDWTIEGEFKKENPSGASGAFLSGGVGWYRKTFMVGDSLKSKKIFIQFDGIYMNSEVWVNNQFLGRYPYGYSLIQYDLTGIVKPGEKNTIAVRVDNSLDPSTRYYAGSGIYRNVWLVTTNVTHLDNKSGVFVSYKNVSEQSATIACQYKIISNSFEGSEFQWWVRNPTVNKRIVKQLTIQSKLYTPNGKEIASMSTIESVSEFHKYTFNHELSVSNPKLWSSATPFLYSLVTTLSYDGKIIDTQTTSIGIRSIEYSVNKGMLVNGKQEKLKGVCLHTDAGSLGNAVPDGVWIYRLSKLKKMGANAIRTSHHPFSPEFYNICDSLGLYVMDEAFDEWNVGYGFATENTAGKMQYGYHLYFNQWAETDLRAMIQRDRNHPSVVMYSIGNEVPNQFHDGGAQLVTKLKNICHNEDPSRLVTAGCDFVAYSNQNGFLDSLDIAGYNYVDRYYADKMYAPEKEKYPNRLYLGTETYFDTPYWLAVRDNDYVMGEFVWAGIDYLGEGIAWPKRGWDACLIDMAGAERPEYYLRKSYWSDEPVVHIAVQNADNPESEWHPRPVVSHWNWKSKPDYLNNVYVYSNCDEVELFINDQSQGKKLVDKNTYFVLWKIPFTLGTIKAIGYTSGKKASEHILQTPENAAGLNLVCDKTNLRANGEDVAVIEINIVDKNGIQILNGDTEISVKIEGNARLIGLDNADQCNHDKYKTASRKTFNGRLLATIQATDKSGKIKVTVSGPDLETANLILNTK